MVRFTVLLFAFAGVAGCGGPAELTCDEAETYQLAVDGKRVVVPDDLDSLEPLREMPLPEASPQPPRPPDSPCIDMPPEARISG